jgi:hypothetical protein
MGFREQRVENFLGYGGGEAKGSKDKGERYGRLFRDGGGGKAMKWYKVGRGQGVGKGRVGKLVEVVERERRV